MASSRLTGSRVQTALFKKLLLPRSGEAWLRQPHRLVSALEALASCESEVRFTGTLPFAQHVAVHLADHMEAYGEDALAVLCAVARCGGHRALNRLAEGASSQLIHTMAVHSGLAHEQLSEKCSTAVAQEARVARAADLLCAIAQMSYRDPALYSLLSGYLADNAEHLHPDHLPLLARAVGASGRDSCQSFVLLHALCRRSAECMEFLDGTAVVALLQIFGRNDFYDEEFLNVASQHLLVSAETLPAGQLGDAMYAYGTLQVRDAPQLDALCEALRPRVDELSEMDLVRSMKGLVKLRHFNDKLLLAFQPVVERQKFHITPLSLTNLISSFSYYADSTSRREVFFNSLLHAATSRASRLAPMSIQHVLTAVCRLQGSLHRDALDTPLEKICAQLAAPGVASQVTPIQAVASITALSKLQHRDCKAAAVLASVLAGRGGDVAWSWAPSAFFYAHTKRLWAKGPAPNVKRCLSILDRELDSSHCVDVLHGLQRLDLHGALVSQLVMLICDRLVPRLHELRAREVLVAARALSATRFPGPLNEEALPQGIASLLCVGGSSEGESPLQPGVPSSWRERAVDSCFENLRRHEHFLEVSWQILLPLKLLCMEIDTGVYGSRRLSEILSPSLLSFVSRLRSLTRAECEAERYRREHADAHDDELTTRPPATDGRAVAGAAAALAGDDSVAGLPATVLESGRHRLVVSGYVQDLPVDLLIESYV